MTQQNGREFESSRGQENKTHLCLSLEVRLTLSSSSMIISGSGYFIAQIPPAMRCDALRLLDRDRGVAVVAHIYGNMELISLRPFLFLVGNRAFINPLIAAPLHWRWEVRLRPLFSPINDHLMRAIRSADKTF